MIPDKHLTWERVATVVMGALLAMLGLVWNGQKEVIFDLKEKVATLEGWKEGVGSRVSVVEAKNIAIEDSITNMRVDIRDLKKDVTEILRRVK